MVGFGKAAPATVKACALRAAVMGG